jgi:hypothetical protein
MEFIDERDIELSSREPFQNSAIANGHFLNQECIYFVRYFCYNCSRQISLAAAISYAWMVDGGWWMVDGGGGGAQWMERDGILMAKRMTRPTWNLPTVADGK